MTIRWKRFLTSGQLHARRQSEREAESVDVMGPQSRRRNNPTQRIRKRPTYQLKHKPMIQKTTEGVKVFDPGTGANVKPKNLLPAYMGCDKKKMVELAKQLPLGEKVEAGSLT